MPFLHIDAGPTRLSEVRAVVGAYDAWLMALGKTLDWLHAYDSSPDKFRWPA